MSQTTEEPKNEGAEKREKLNGKKGKQKERKESRAEGERKREEKEKLLNS